MAEENKTPWPWYLDPSRSPNDARWGSGEGDARIPFSKEADELFSGFEDRVSSVLSTLGMSEDNGYTANTVNDLLGKVTDINQAKRHIDAKGANNIAADLGANGAEADFSLLTRDADNETVNLFKNYTYSKAEATLQRAYGEKYTDSMMNPIYDKILNASPESLANINSSLSSEEGLQRLLSPTSPGDEQGEQSSEQQGGQDSGATGQQSGSNGDSGKKKKKKKEKKNKFSKIDDEVSKDVDAAISNAVESGGDVSAAVKGATKQGEISRYHQYASTINKKLRADFQKSEVERAKAVEEANKKVGPDGKKEVFEPGNFFDYARKDENVMSMLAGANNETVDRVTGTLTRMGEARDKNNKLIEGYDKEIQKLDKAKQEMYDTAKLSTRQKFFIGARNLVDRATTLASHPMQTVKAMFSGKDAPIGDAIKERNERMAGRRQEALDKNVDKQYQKEYGDHDRHVRMTRAALAERNRQINEVTGDAVTLYGSQDMNARSAARKNMTASTRKQLAEAAKKGSKGLGWKGKAGAAAALLGGLAVLGTMMGNHGEQSNAQLYNPGPQPQYAN